MIKYINRVYSQRMKQINIKQTFMFEALMVSD